MYKELLININLGFKYFDFFKKTFFKKNIFAYKDPTSIESEFMWLIKIGILRREVDGQGLTSKVRITPLGREAFEKNLTSLKEKKHYIHKIIFCFMNTIRNK